MPIRFFCKMCGNRLKAREEHKGRKVRCTDCGETIQIPQVSEIESPAKVSIEFETIAESEPTEKPKSKFWTAFKRGIKAFREDNAEKRAAHSYRWPVLILIVIFHLLFILEYWDGRVRFSTEQNLSHMITFPLYYWLFRDYSKQKRLVVLVPLFVAAIYIQNWTGTYLDSWKDENDARHTVRKRRSDDVAIYKYYSGDGEFGLRADGPLAETGSLHGRWEKSIGITFETTVQWYWHGEKVTEAEFFRLEKGR